MDRHNDAVAAISASVRKFHAQNKPFRIYHGSTNSTRPLSFQRDKMVNTSDLSHVLKVDTDARTVLVEPNVPMDLLVQATLPYGLVPPVVMEFPGITVGGGFAGTSGESSSFKYGFFDWTVNWTEMVLPNGDVVIVSPSNKPDLFHGAAGSFGTLGVTTLLEIRLIDAKTYVELTYHPVTTTAQAVQMMKDFATDPATDYLDGILFSLHKGFIITGRLTDTLSSPSLKVRLFSRAWDPWFYRHVEKLPVTKPTTEAVPLVDYLFRYDRGGFWVGHYGFKYFLMPFNRVTRFLLNPFMHTRVMYHALHESGLSHRYIVQDLALPASKTEQFIDYCDAEFNIYPLWLCPLRQSEQDAEVSLHPHSSTSGEAKGNKRELLINVGLWGPGPSPYSSFVAANRRLEQQIRSLGGMKWLYAHAYYTEDEFWAIYDRSWYDALRRKYDASWLPSVYDKVKVDPEKARRAVAGVWSLWPLSGLYGVGKVVLGRREYLLAGGKGWNGRVLGLLVLLLGLMWAAVRGILPDSWTARWVVSGG
jgi:Delta24-sterol reductase